MSRGRKVKIPRADDTRPREAGPSKVTCECRNHLGRPKIPHKSKQAAMLDGIRKIGFSGHVEAYKCPTSDRWHTTTRRRS